MEMKSPLGSSDQASWGQCPHPRLGDLSLLSPPCTLRQRTPPSRIPHTTEIIYILKRFSLSIWGLQNGDSHKMELENLVYKTQLAHLRLKHSCRKDSLTGSMWQGLSLTPTHQSATKCAYLSRSPDEKERKGEVLNPPGPKNHHFPRWLTVMSTHPGTQGQSPSVSLRRYLHEIRRQ